MTCKHKLKHTEKVEGEKADVSLIGGELKIGPRNSSLRTYCADCGKLLKDVELNDYVK